MFKLFQENFDFKAFVFTNTSDILKECASYGIETLPYVEHNPYGLPYIGSMFTNAYGRRTRRTTATSTRTFS